MANNGGANGGLSGKQKSIILALISGIVAIGVAYLQYRKAPEIQASFTVRVLDGKDRNKGLSLATVILAVPGKVPVPRQTDTNGYTTFPVEDVSKNGKVTVKLEGYVTQEVEISLAANNGSVEITLNPSLPSPIPTVTVASSPIVSVPKAGPSASPEIMDLAKQALLHQLNEFGKIDPNLSDEGASSSGVKRLASKMRIAAEVKLDEKKTVGVIVTVEVSNYIISEKVGKSYRYLGLVRDGGDELPVVADYPKRGYRNVEARIKEDSRYFVKVYAWKDKVKQYQLSQCGYKRQPNGKFERVEANCEGKS